MSKYRQRLPQLEGGLFLTDGGLETTLIFHERVELPLFAAFDLLRDKAGREKLRQYFLPLHRLAARAWRRLHSGEPDLARQPRLGREAWLFGRRRWPPSTVMPSS